MCFVYQRGEKVMKMLFMGSRGKKRTCTLFGGKVSIFVGLNDILCFCLSRPGMRMGTLQSGKRAVAKNQSQPFLLDQVTISFGA